MTGLAHAVTAVRKAQKKSGKPLAVVLAGHNGSGKSTLWYGHLANSFQIPLVNADRMMMSILPEVQKGRCLPSWASTIRDSNESWMQVAQKGVQAFVAQAMANNVPFAMETVFSHWKKRADGTIESKRRFRYPNRNRDRDRRERWEFDPDTDSDLDFDWPDAIKIRIAGFFDVGR